MEVLTIQFIVWVFTVAGLLAFYAQSKKLQRQKDLIYRNAVANVYIVSSLHQPTNRESLIHHKVLCDILVFLDSGAEIENINVKLMVEKVREHYSTFTDDEIDKALAEILCQLAE